MKRSRFEQVGERLKQCDAYLIKVQDEIRTLCNQAGVYAHACEDCPVHLLDSLYKVRAQEAYIRELTKHLEHEGRRIIQKKRLKRE